MQLSELKIQALTHYVSKKVDVQGLYYVLSTGRITPSQETKIGEVVGDMYFQKEMMHQMRERSFECLPNPKVANNKKIIKMADELAEMINQYPLYRIVN